MPIVRLPRHKEFVHLLRRDLPAAKASHSIFVAEYLSSFAEGIGLDHDEAVTAGLLHDLCRTLDDQTLLSRAAAYELPISDEQRAHPNLLHGPVAAELCRRELGIEAAPVYEAIYWHTTGKPGLCRLGQALCVADFAEPARRYPEAAQARELLRKEGFDEALFFVAQQKLAFIQKKHISSPMAEGFFLWVQQVVA